MGKSAQACLKSSYRYFFIGEQSCKRFTIYRYRSVGTFSALSALGIGIIPTFFLEYGIIRHHTVYISARYKKTVFRLTELFEILIGYGLSDYSYITAAAFKHTGYNSYTK